MKKILTALLFSFVLCLTYGAELRFKDAEIVLPEKPSWTAVIAAQELQYHLQKMTGGRFPIVKKSSAQYASAIYVGDRSKAAAAGFPVKNIKADGFLRGVKGKDLYIAGSDDKMYKKGDVVKFYFETRHRGTLHGVYDFLEEQGVRWPAPGKGYEYIPARKEIAVSGDLKMDAPCFSQRNMTKINAFAKYSDSKVYTTKRAEAVLWALRMRASCIRGIGDGSHTEIFLKLGQIWFKDHPERFQLMQNGTRNPRYACWSDPHFKDIWMKLADAYFSGKTPADAGFPHIKSWHGWNVKDEFLINAMDHGSKNDGRCRCKRCNEFRKKNPCLDDTELYWQLIADVAKQIEKKHPGKYIAALVYPPMTRFPKTVKLPGNLRVRICQGGIKDMLLPNVLKDDLEQIRLWRTQVGYHNVVLGIYVCENFADRLPAFPESYPRLTADYFRTLAGKCTGARIAYTGPTHTERVLDMYVQSKLLWNPHQNVEHIIKDHCRIMYGPAAEIMEKIYSRFEENFCKYYKAVTPNVARPREIGIDRDVKKNRIHAWTKVYTVEEMKNIRSLLEKAEKSVAGKEPYARRLKAFRTWVWEIMEAERKEVIDIQSNPLQLKLRRNRWSPWQQLHQMSHYAKDAAGTKFRVKHDGKVLTLQILADEPEIKKVKFDPKASPENLWKDDTIELFVETQGKTRQIVFSASGKYSSRLTPENKWETVPGLVHTVRNHTSLRRLEITLPLTQEMKKNFRLNVTRSRKLTNKLRESSTWSENAKRNWLDPKGYAAIVIK